MARCPAHGNRIQLNPPERSTCLARPLNQIVVGHAGIRALAVHAKNERARGFYEHFGFRPSPSDPLHLFVLLKDLQSMSPI